MLEAVKYNLSHVLDFTGRDARQTFWYYVLFLVVLEYIIGMIAAVPMMVGVIRAAMDAARTGVPEPALQAQMMGQMSGAVGGMLWVSLATNAAFALLLLAAFVRRLHDSNKSGWWAALAAAGRVLGTLVSIRMIGVMQDVFATPLDPNTVQSIMERQPEMNVYALAGWIGPIVVIGFGVLKSTDGPNRYGEHPVRF